jgi:hypothetical protein
MAIHWMRARHTRAYANELVYAVLHTSLNGTPIPHIKGVGVSIHETPDHRFFIGARLQSDEPNFPPHFQPSLEAAKFYVELVKD